MRYQDTNIYKCQVHRSQLRSHQWVQEICIDVSVFQELTRSLYNLKSWEILNNKWLNKLLLKLRKQVDFKMMIQSLIILLLKE